ncbi:DEAD-box ATP-dependent RNA helicase 32 [Argentina anserina]|uniref:DEAD-box ATP-dependent RNA helicase 32 n=1 Tax=Argentina anserina TaxID=57926 RepID=UPI0021763B57|nr:DEAD-box ATP-dependent RNA helicase 32 [Potentilla anserina]
MKKPISKTTRKQKLLSEVNEIELLNSWIESKKPDSGSNPMSLPPLPSNSPIGRVDSTSFSRYAGATKFAELPISRKTRDALRQANYKDMTDIQRACLPHALCGRDILGAAKTGSGKTLAFLIPLLEKLYKERWNPEDGVGCIIISPTRELASQTFDVLRAVGKHHNFSAGLLIGGRKDVEAEKERVNELNILVCTPGRLLQHMDETPNFECSQLQVLVLDEADRILDVGFKKALNAIISQLPKRRQTFLFSATQTKSVQDLARLSLKDPEYLSVHEQATRATPNRLKQTAMIVPLDKKLDMLWSFIKAHLNSRILVFLSTRKQVKFVYEAFKKLRPGIPLKCLHGKMKQEGRMGTYSQFHEKATVLFSTDVASRGLDFNQAVDWVVQVDCPEDVASYIHRVGRTARYQSEGRSLLFVMPSETKMLEKLEAAKIPIESIKVNNKRLQPISGLLSALLVKYPGTLPSLAKRAFITYLKSIQNHKDKEVFDVMQLPVDEFSASMGLPMTPRIRFSNHKLKSKKPLELSPTVEPEQSDMENALGTPREELDIGDSEEEEVEGLLRLNDTPTEREEEGRQIPDIMPATRVLKKNKLKKIHLDKPTGQRTIFDEDGIGMDPLAMLSVPADPSILDGLQDKKEEYHMRMREEVKKGDKQDKETERKRRREIRMNKKMKLKRANAEEGDDVSESEEEPSDHPSRKRSKIYFDSDDDGEREDKKNKAGLFADKSYIDHQEALALKWLGSMHKN